MNDQIVFRPVLLLLLFVLGSCGAEPEGSFEEVDNDASNTSGVFIDSDSTLEPASNPAAPADSDLSLEDQATGCFAETANSSDGAELSPVLDCLEDIRSRQVLLDDGAAERLNTECIDIGGAACTELLLRTYNEDYQLIGLSCGGRSPEIPCPVGPSQIPDQGATAVESSNSEQAAVDPPIQQESPADVLAGFLSGNIVLYSIKEVDRPIYGWQDFTFVTYCSDGTFFYQSEGERRTVLDNTEYRSYAGQGTWIPLELANGSVTAQLQFDEGGVGGFLLWPGSNGFQHDVGVSSEISGPAGC